MQLDTLDLDTQTPNCDDSQDTSELGTRVAWPDRPDEHRGFPSISACEDGIDNDRDGLIDGYDPACADGGDGELLTACADGIDKMETA